jgi:hypothetical protein
MNKPNISKRAFWWVDFDKIDFDTHKKRVIYQVCLNGKDSDFLEILGFYGNEAVECIIDERMEEISKLSIDDTEALKLKLRKRQIATGFKLMCKGCKNTEESSMKISKDFTNAQSVAYEIECRMCGFITKFNL